MLRPSWIRFFGRDRFLKLESLRPSTLNVSEMQTIGGNVDSRYGNGDREGKSHVEASTEFVTKAVPQLKPALSSTLLLASPIPHNSQPSAWMIDHIFGRPSPSWKRTQVRARCPARHGDL